MAVKFKIKGLRELDRTLTELAPAIASRAGDKAIAGGGKVVWLEADRLVPRKTGALRASLVLVTGKAAIKDARRSGRNIDENTRVALIGFRGRPSRIAHLLEFGTRHAAPHPFLRPALNSKARLAVTTTAGVLGREIIKETKKARR